MPCFRLLYSYALPPALWIKSDGCLIFEGIGADNRFLGLKVVFLYGESGWLTEVILMSGCGRSGGRLAYKHSSVSTHGCELHPFAVFSVYFQMARLPKRISKPRTESIHHRFRQRLRFQQILIQSVNLAIDLQPSWKLHRRDCQFRFIAAFSHIFLQCESQCTLLISFFFLHRLQSMISRRRASVISRKRLDIPSGLSREWRGL